MEHVLLLIPTFFCILTGILIAWGVQTETSIINIVRIVSQFKDSVRPTEYLRGTVIGVATILLAVLLFAVPEFAAFHMVTILLMELWYAAFLFCVSKEYMQVEQTIIDVKHSLELAHIDKDSD